MVFRRGLGVQGVVLGVQRLVLGVEGVVPGVQGVVPFFILHLRYCLPRLCLFINTAGIHDLALLVCSPAVRPAVRPSVRPYPLYRSQFLSD